MKKTIVVISIIFLWLNLVLGAYFLMRIEPKIKIVTVTEEVTKEVEKIVYKEGKEIIEKPVYIARDNKRPNYEVFNELGRVNSYVSGDTVIASMDTVGPFLYQTKEN